MRNYEYGAKVKHEYLNNKLFESIISGYQTAVIGVERYTLITKNTQDQITDLNLRNKQSVFLEDTLATAQQQLKLCQREREDFQHKLAIAFYSIAEGILKKYTFRHLDWSDALQEACLVSFRKIMKFDTRKGKGFNYITTVMLNHFRQQYRLGQTYVDHMYKYGTFLTHIGEIPR